MLGTFEGAGAPTLRKPSDAHEAALLEEVFQDASILAIAKVAWGLSMGVELVGPRRQARWDSQWCHSHGRCQLEALDTLRGGGPSAFP
jgi:hypothetical protein